MQPLLSRDEIRKIDLEAVETLGVPELILMEHAAIAVLNALKSRYSDGLSTSTGLILAGCGNNGGDALALARLLYHEGVHDVTVVILGEKERQSKSSLFQWNLLERLKIPVQRKLDPESLRKANWVVDGLFGTGLTRAMEGIEKEAVRKLNEASFGKWVVAIDIPSGLSSDTGNPLGETVRASVTVALGYWKRGLVTGMAADFVGTLQLGRLPFPKATSEAWLFDSDSARALPRRNPTSHKGTYGHVYLWAGEPEKLGASGIAAIGALRAGAGLATLVGSATELASLRNRLALEVMTASWTPDFFSRVPASVAAIGPGLGQTDQAWEILIAALKSRWSLVLDADALNVIATRGREGIDLVANRKGLITILTPHPKEASRLLECKVEDIQADRYATVRKLSDRFRASVLLKGKGTVLTSPSEPLWVVNQGDSGLAKGGTGDLLTGILAALVAQGLAPQRAMALACYLHGRASELTSQRLGTERSVMASEIAEEISSVYRELES